MKAPKQAEKQKPRKTKEKFGTKLLEYESKLAWRQKSYEEAAEMERARKAYRGSRFEVANGLNSSDIESFIDDFSFSFDVADKFIEDVLFELDVVDTIESQEALRIDAFWETEDELKHRLQEEDRIRDLIIETLSKSDNKDDDKEEAFYSLLWDILYELKYNINDCTHSVLKDRHRKNRKSYWFKTRTKQIAHRKHCQMRNAHYRDEVNRMRREFSSADDAFFKKALNEAYADA